MYLLILRFNAFYNNTDLRLLKKVITTDFIFLCGIKNKCCFSIISRISRDLKILLITLFLHLH